MSNSRQVIELLSTGEAWRAAELVAALACSEIDMLASELAAATDRARLLETVDLLASFSCVPHGTLERERLLRLEALRMLAAAVAHAAVDENRRDLSSAIRALAGDPSYRVREATVRLIARIASGAFEDTREFWRECIAGDEPVVAGTVLRGLAASKAPVHEVLRLFHGALRDIRKDVRHSLGPRAIPELGRREPRIVYDQLALWAKDTDEMVRWNIAQALSTYLGAAFPEEAMDILAAFAADERPAVWRAAAVAIVQAAQRRPAFVLPMLRRWREDFSRHRCAKLVLETLVRR